MTIERFRKGTALEELAGYSRAVRVGPLVYIAGCGSFDSSGTFVAGDAAAQTRVALESVSAALEHAGAAVEDVVSTRLFVVDIDDWEAVVKVHGEVFGAHPPVSTLVAVQRLIDPRMLVEIEAVAHDSG